jgi:hypothetical protein
MPLSIPQTFMAAAAGIVTIFAQTNFSNTIPLGSIILGLIVVAVAGFFTIRSNIASTWKDNYEGERVKRKQAEEDLVNMKAELLDQMASEREEQGRLRHDLKDQLATVKAQLMVAQAKTDLSVVMATQVEMRDVLHQLADAATKASRTDEKLDEVHHLVNSHRDELLAEISRLLAEISRLRDRLGLPADDPSDPTTPEE